MEKRTADFHEVTKSGYTLNSLKKLKLSFYCGGNAAISVTEVTCRAQGKKGWQELLWSTDCSPQKVVLCLVHAPLVMEMCSPRKTP